jgi:Carboxypeptidase regulatory-like domain/TonB-dependent Receptor Plug Domain
MGMNRNVRGYWITLLSVALVSWISGVAPAHLNGQGATATISGRVMDMSGAAVAAAEVQVKNNATGGAQTTASDEQGRYTLADLPVGEYDIHVSKAGFSNMVRTGVTLTVGAQSVVDFSLQVGQQLETITVQAEASLVDTSNSTVGTLTDEKQMSGLPLNGRNFEQLIQLSAGVNTLQGNSFVASGFQGRAPEYSIAGSRPEGQAILLDDENLQNFWNKGMGSVMGTSLGVEAIGEFQTLTDTYSAQFGGNGGVINAVSKTGSNNFHGSLYEFFRNSDLDARQFIDPATIPALRQNQFGGTLGGPIKKDKMFFFVNYEGIRLVQGESRIAQVPGCNLDAGNCIPTTTNPVAAQAIVNTLHAWPNATTVVNGQPEALSVANENASENYVLARFDYNEQRFHIRALYLGQSKLCGTLRRRWFRRWPGAFLARTGLFPHPVRHHRMEANSQSKYGQRGARQLLSPGYQ